MLARRNGENYEENSHVNCYNGAILERVLINAHNSRFISCCARSEERGVLQLSARHFQPNIKYIVYNTPRFQRPYKNKSWRSEERNL